jgi:hypothetical protein
MAAQNATYPGLAGGANRSFSPGVAAIIERRYQQPILLLLHDHIGVTS